MERNTLENKARFFAQYWGQNVMIEFSGIRPMQTYSVGNIEIVNQSSQKYWLELTPLCQISDEDAIKIARLLGWKDHAKDQALFYGLYFINGGEDSCLLEDYACVVDYLRSKGYALPYMELSVEDLIEYGWIKLKGETK